MRKICLTAALLLIGIVAPILACSDHSGKAGIAGPAMPACVATSEEPRTGINPLQMPWSEDKTLSDRDINEIMKTQNVNGRRVSKPSGH